MRPTHETSTIEVRLPSGDFVQTHMERVDVGDVFRIRRPNGVLHCDSFNRTQWTVSAMPHIPCEDVPYYDHE